MNLKPNDTAVYVGRKKMLARPIHSCKGSRNYYELTWEAIIDCVCEVSTSTE